MKRILSIFCALALILATILPAQAQQINQTAATLTNSSTFAGNCVTVNSCATLKLGLLDRTATIEINGTFSQANEFFEASNSGGSQWAAIAGTTWLAGAAVSSSQATGGWTFNVAGLTNIRVRQDSLLSGAVIVSLSSSPAGASIGQHP